MPFIQQYSPVANGYAQLSQAPLSRMHPEFQAKVLELREHELFRQAVENFGLDPDNVELRFGEDDQGHHVITVFDRDFSRGGTIPYNLDPYINQFAEAICTGRLPPDKPAPLRPSKPVPRPGPAPRSAAPVEADTTDAETDTPVRAPIPSSLGSRTFKPGRASSADHRLFAQISRERHLEMLKMMEMIQRQGPFTHSLPPTLSAQPSAAAIWGSPDEAKYPFSRPEEHPSSEHMQLRDALAIAERKLAEQHQQMTELTDGFAGVSEERRAELEEVKAQLADSQAKMLALGQERTALQQQLAALQAQAPADPAQIAQLEREKQALTAQLAASNARIDKLESELNAQSLGSQARIQALHQEVLQEKTANAQLQTQLSALETRTRELSDQNQHQSEEFQALSSRAIAHNGQTQQLQARILELEAEKLQAEGKHNQLENSLIEMGEDFLDSTQEFEGLLEERDQRLERQEAANEARIQQLQARILKSEDETSQALEAGFEVEAKLNALKDVHEQLQSDYQQKIAGKQELIDRLEKSLITLRAILDRTTQQAETAIAQGEEYKQRWIEQNEAYATELLQLQTKIQILTSEKADLERARAAEPTPARAAELERNYQERIQNAARSDQVLQDQWKSAQLELKEQTAQLELKREKFEKEIRAKEDTIDSIHSAYQKKIEEMKADAQSRATIESLQGELRMTGESLEDARREKALLEEQVQRLTSEIEQLRVMRSRPSLPANLQLPSRIGQRDDLVRIAEKEAEMQHIQNQFAVERAQFEAELQAKSAQFHAIQETLSAKQSELAEAVSHRGLAQSEIEDLQRELESAQHSLSENESLIRNLRGQIAAREREAQIGNIVPVRLDRVRLNQSRARITALESEVAALRPAPAPSLPEGRGYVGL